MVKTVVEIIQDVVPYYKDRVGKQKAGLIPTVAEEEHLLRYDSSTETLEPVYFWILDLMKDDFGFDVEKLADSFTASPGSGHFSELNQKMSIMQQQLTKTMGDVNNVLRTVLNLIYDLKEFRTRLQQYDDLQEDKTEIAARLALKQIWMDKVDIQKGNSSIKGMAMGQAGFQTLIDAFLQSDSIEDVNKLDLNDRIKRILIPRVQDFNHWVSMSETELRKRYKIQKGYLKAQVNNLKLYSRWAKPYLKAATQLEQKDQGTNPALVDTFNTLWLELTLFGKQAVKPESFIGDNKIAKDIKSLKINQKYYKCVLVDFVFRGIPQRLPQQGYVHGGKVDVTFRGYVLNEDEIAKLHEELNKSDLANVLALAEGVTEEGLKEMQDEIDFFLDDKEFEEAVKNTKVKSKGDVNPFIALIGGYDKKKNKKEKGKNDSKKEVVLRKETWGEKEFMRKMVGIDAEEITFKFYNVYKKAHGMVNYDV